MPLDTSMIGEQTRTFEHHVDARWLMAYAAGLGDMNPRYMDTSAGTVVGHPVFPVCLEWPVILSSREAKGYETTTPEEAARGVHAAHDLHLFKPIRAGEKYRTVLTIVGLDAIRPGAAQTSKIETFDAAGELVCRTWQLGISRGVAVTGGDENSETPPVLPDLGQLASSTESLEIPVAAGLGNVYTETARIFNPIHSDKAFALAAGLPDIILHGTATLALAISRLVDRFAGGDPTRVTRLGGRFTGMVLMPSTLTLVITGTGDGIVGFEVKNPGGETAFGQGFLCYS